MIITISEGIPFITDVLVQTQTKRSDWLTGNKQIAAYTGRKPGTIAHWLATGMIPEAVKVRSLYGTQAEYTWILRKSDADKHKREAA